jgi:hypothetical protein
MEYLKPESSKYAIRPCPHLVLRLLFGPKRESSSGPFLLQAPHSQMPLVP